MSGPFAETEPLCVVRCVRLSCSSDVTTNSPDESSAVEARFGNFESPHEAVESVHHFPKRSEWFAVVVCIARCVREVRGRCFCECQSLVGNPAGHGHAFVHKPRTTLVNHSCLLELPRNIPASPVIRAITCSPTCRCYLWCIIQVERICAYAFYETGIAHGQLLCESQGCELAAL